MFETMYPDFDICSVLAIIEFVINCFAQAVMIVAVHAIASDRFLHGNFKFVMCMTLSRTLLNGVRRTFGNYLTIFWTTGLSPRFLCFYKHVSMFTSTLLSISMPFVAIDRLLYTYNIGNYETRKASACLSVARLLWDITALYQIILSIGISVFDKSMIPLSFKFISPVVTLLVRFTNFPLITKHLVVDGHVYRANQKRRHSQTCSSLDEKALARRNMNSVVLFLLPMACASSFSIITGVLMLRKYVVFSEEFGYRDTTYNAVMGLVVALDNLLTPSIAYACHRFLQNRIDRRVQCELRAFSSKKSNEHFNQLKKSWRMP